MLSGGLIGEFGELADQFLEDGAHLGVADDVRVQVDARELFRDEIEQVGLGEAVDLGMEVERLEDVAYGRAEGLHVGAEVFADVVLVPHQLLHVERRGVVEELPGLAEQERLGVDLVLGPLLLLGEHGLLGRLQHAIETAQDGERQNDLPVLGLLVIAPEEIGDGPDEGGEVRVAHGLGSCGAGGWFDRA